MAKGYKLTNATGDGPKTCAFFFSDKGCRNGANCKFSHDAATASAAASAAVSPPTPSVASSSVMSSESDSEGEIIESRAGAYASMANSGNPFLSSVATDAAPAAPAAVVVAVSKQKQQPSAEKKRKTASTNNLVATDGNPFLSVVKAETAQSQPPVTPIVSVAPPPKKLKQAIAPPTTTNINNKQPHPTTNNNNNSSTLPSFRNLQLPVASFHIPNSVATSKVDTSTSRPLTPQHEPAPVPPPPPLPTATPSHLKWKLAVLATRGHSNYANAFNFERTQQAEWSNGISSPADWINSRPYSVPEFASNPAAIAIDCEMCETTDPVTGKINPKALCRISIVDAENPQDVLLDTLVKPEWPISNYRTWINGISAENLNNVQFTLKHAQTFLNALCSEQTVIVGHAVHNDLFALQMVHHCVVDTAMLYAHADENDGTPSLRNLAHGVLQAREMPEVHDSVNDARVALACARNYIDKKGVVEPIEKVYSRSNSRRLNNDGLDTTASLMVHRLPVGTLSSHIAEMFVAFTYITPKHVPEIEFSGGKQGKCLVEFTTAEHAELAYNSLVGREGEDKTGKKQKRVGIKSGGYVCVRKMRAEKK